MLRKTLGVAGIGICILLSNGGCGKSTPAPSVTLPVKTNALAALNSAPVTLFQSHWIGAKSIATATNAGTFLTLCQLPESKNIELQTLERLALTLIGNGTNWQPAEFVATNPATYKAYSNSTPLLPVLLDLVQEESYCEIQQRPGSSAEIALAVHLSEEQSRRWQTNLSLAFGASPDGSRWQLTNWTASLGTNGGSHTLELSRAGNYTLLGIAGLTNVLLADFVERINHERVPFAGPATNYWLSMGIDIRRLAKVLGADNDLPANIPSISVTAIGEPDGLRTRVQMDFPEPLPDKVEAWSVPTNVVHDPLISFTALRGISSWISATKTWQSLQAGAAPDQIYFWAQGGLPFISYLAAPATNASALAARLSDKLFQANPWLDTNGLGIFQKATNFDGIIWSNLTIMTPFVRVETNGAENFIYAGLESDVRTNRPMPLQLAEALTSRTNVMAYDWEFTGPRLEQWLYFGQFLRFAVHLGQIPPKSASFAWLSAMTPQLGNSVTIVTKTGPNQLLLGRKSDLGLTSAELDLLADWLESPQFPKGLNTFLGKAAPLPKNHPRHATKAPANSVPPAKH